MFSTRTAIFPALILFLVAMPALLSAQDAADRSAAQCLIPPEDGLPGNRS